MSLSPLAKKERIKNSDTRVHTKNSRHFINGDNNNIREESSSSWKKEDLIKKFPRLIKVIDHAMDGVPDCQRSEEKRKSGF